MFNRSMQIQGTCRRVTRDSKRRLNRDEALNNANEVGSIIREDVMLKRFVPFAGAIALAVVFAAGCQDSQPTNASPTGTIEQGDQYAVYSSSFEATGEVRSFEDFMNDPSLLTPPPVDPNDPGGRGGRGGRGGDDSVGNGDDRDSVGHGGGRGGDDSVRHDGGRGGRRGDDTNHRKPDTNHRKPDTNERRPPKPPTANLREIIKALNLSPRQEEAVKRCIAALNECLRGVDARLRNALHELRAKLHEDLREIRAAVENGRLTPEEGRRLYNQKVEAYKAAAERLKAGAERAKHDCLREFDRCVRAVLEGHQIGIWERMFKY